MSKEYDAAAKKLVDLDPMAWVLFCGLPGVSAVVVDSDLNMPMSADRVVLVTEADGSQYLLHIEFEVGWSGESAHRIMYYHVALGYRHSLPVKTVVFLLRKQANSPRITGHFKFGDAEFSFSVVRLWDTDPERFLGGSMALLPFAPLAKVNRLDVPSLLGTMQMQTRTVPGKEEAEWWALIHLLMGLCYAPDESYDLLKGVFRMLDLKKSSTYQSILAEGRVEGRAEGREEGRKEGRAQEARKLLLVVGRGRLGEPDAAVMETVEDIASPERVESLVARLFEVESWEDLLR